MPIHDWTRVEAGVFHDFHHRWIGNLCAALNTGLLPDGYYSMMDQVAGGLGPDVLSLRSPDGGPAAGSPGVLAVAETPPRVRMQFRPEKVSYTRRQRALVIRHTSEHQMVAIIEIVSAGNKGSRSDFQTFIDKTAAALSRGIHLLVIDLYPPGRRDPQGTHGALWDALVGEDSYRQPADKPLTLAAYAAGLPPTAYVEPIAVGDPLPDMPLFLATQEYINVPLEATYQQTFAATGKFNRDILQRPAQ